MSSSTSFVPLKKFLSINAASSEAFCSNQAVCFRVKSSTFALSLTLASSSCFLASASKAVSAFLSLSSFVSCAFCFCVLRFTSASSSIFKASGLFLGSYLTTVYSLPSGVVSVCGFFLLSLILTAASDIALVCCPNSVLLALLYCSLRATASEDLPPFSFVTCSI